MIATSIDGSSSGGTNQLMELLSIVSSPDYKAKLKALQDAAQKNEDLINLIAPATEIMTIREQIAADKKASDDAVSLAKGNADKVVADAKDSASLIVQEANDKADALISEATAINATAKSDQAELKKSVADAKKAKASSDAATAATNAKAADLNSAITAAIDSKAKFEALKAEIIEKHQKFIASL